MHRSLGRLAISLGLVVPSVVIPSANATPDPISAQGEPWLGLASIGTYTNHTRQYNLSIEDVDSLPAGDRATWNYSPSTPLTLRLEWWFHDGGAPGHNARSARVFLRYLNGARIGTTVWTTAPDAIPDGRYGGPASGVLTKTIHLDDDPMDGIYSGRGQAGQFELYMQVFGGMDNGADTRSLNPTGGATASLRARGLLSNIDLKLYDAWNSTTPNATSNPTWSTTKWTTNPGSGRVIDVDNDTGRLQVAGSGSVARATSRTPTARDQDLLFTYRFADRTPGSDLRVHLRGSDQSSSTSGVKYAYRLDIDSNDTTVKLKKLVNGSASTIGSFVHTPPDPAAPQRVNFVVSENRIMVDVWPANEPQEMEKQWDLEIPTDTAVTTAGVLQLAHYQYGSGTSPRAVYIDDLELVHVPLFGSEVPECPTVSQPPPGSAPGTLQECDYIPPLGAHATKIYVSPADHYRARDDANENIGCDSFSETFWANSIAPRVGQLLKGRGYYVRVGFSSLGRPRPGKAGGATVKRDASNNWKPAAHIPIHSNALGGTQDPETKATCDRGPNPAGGTQMLHNTQPEDVALAQAILSKLHPTLPNGAPGSPGGSDVLVDMEDGYAEIDGIKLAAVGYVERGFHTNPAEKDWMIQQEEGIALAIAEGIDLRRSQCIQQNLTTCPLHPNGPR